MTVIQDTDMRRTIDTLRPGSEYHWRGEGQFGNDMSALGEWRDGQTTPPTEQEIIDHWDNVITILVADEAAAAAAQAAAKGQAQNIPGWASWDEQAALDWIDTNIEPELTSAAPNTLQALRAIARLLIALRNEIYPDLQA